MKYYSIHFGSVEHLRYAMSRVFKLLNRNGIDQVHFTRQAEYRYDFEIGNELTFICVIRGGVGSLQGIRVLGSYSAQREPIEEPRCIYEWIMHKYSCELSLKNIDRTSVPANLFYCPFKIKKVIFNDPATIVFWSDGSKTVVKAQNGEVYDKEKGLAMAITKKWFGNQGNYYNNIKKWLSKDI